MPQISPAPSTGGYMPGLDGLRAYAVMIVVAFHCAVPGFSGGWVGVDVFFGLSGFLITGILIAERERSGVISLRRFWARRFRRLVPALVALLGVCIVLAAVWDLVLSTSGVWGAVTYTTNWLNIVLPGHGYWDLFAAPDPLEHLWSLAIEEQFYLVWPLVILAFGRRLGRRGIGRLALVLAGVSVAVQLAGVAAGWSIDRLYQGTDTRAFPFLLGGALACWGVPALSARWTAAIGAVGVAVLVLATIGLDGSDTSIFLGPLQAVSIAGVAVVAVGARATNPLVCHPLPRTIGRWSYGIYLFHYPLVLVLPADTPTVTRTIVVIIGSVGLAAASYRFVETPVRTGELTGVRLALAPVAMVGVVIVALVLATPAEPEQLTESKAQELNWDALAGPATGGDDQPTTVPVASSPPTSSPEPALDPVASGGPDPSVVASGPPTSNVVVPAPAEIRSLLVLGDSTARVIATALAEQPGMTVVDGSELACPFVTVALERPSVSRTQETDFCPTLDMQMRALELIRPDAVLVVVGPTGQWDQMYAPDGEWASPGDPEWIAHHDAHLAALLASAPSIPFVVTDVPAIRPPEMDALTTPERLDALNDQILAWDADHAQVVLMPYAHYLADAWSEEGRRERPDGAHLEKGYAEQLVTDHLLADLSLAVARAQSAIAVTAG